MTRKTNVEHYEDMMKKLEELTGKFKILEESVTLLKESNDNMKILIKELTETNSSQRKVIDCLLLEKEEMKGLLNTHKKNSEVVSESKVIDIIKDYENIREKEKGIVIVGLVEKENEELTNTGDLELANSIIKEAGVSSQTVSVFRHGRKGSRPRILKIKLDSKENARMVLRSNEARSKLPKGSFMRRDMTMAELEEERRLRQECMKMNEDAKLFKYVVRNFKIIELRNPHPWINKTLRNA